MYVFSFKGVFYVTWCLSCNEKGRNRLLSQQHYLSQQAHQPRTEEDAHCAYRCALKISSEPLSLEESLAFTNYLSFEKIISLVNFRDNGMYIPTPIYLHKNYFSYYLDLHHELKFDIDDLFYYSSHKILKRQGHLYVNDYGMQITILNRYGIKNYGVRDRDYRFVNGDDHDLRYSNIEIINRYHGVFVFTKNEKTRYRVRLHINGNYTIGTYRSETQAAVAYNKAVDLARQHGICKNFPENYIEDLSARDYADIYTKAKISTNFLEYLKNLSTENNIV